MKKDAFVVYGAYEEHVNLLSDEQAGRLFRALLAYHNGTEVPELDSVTRIAFSFIRAQMDHDAAKYEETCRKNAENGAKGGRPKKAVGNSESERFSEKANGFSEKHNEYDNDNDLLKREIKKRKRRINSFNNFPERAYDFDELEKALREC